MKRPHGSIRQSQLITTYGPGAMVDLPHHSVIVSGLEEWSFGDARQPIFEDRLVSKLEALLEVKGLSLFAPPTEPKDPHAAPTGITGWQFPEWFVAQYEEWRGSYPARPLVHRRGLVNERYVAPDRKRLPVVPVRFVQGCVNGHISDIDWYRFVHESSQEPCRRPLWMQERGTSGDLADVFVACECGKVRSMGVAAVRGADTLGFCRGLRPWLGPVASERCGGEEGKPQPNRLLLRSASDAYFSQVLRVISIPDRDAELKMAVDKVWEDFLQYVEGLDDLKRERKKAKVFGALEGHPDVGVLAEIERRKGGSAASPKSIKQVEIETLLASGDQIGEDAPEGADFYARRLPVGNAGVLKAVERVVLLDRLREVMALVGFTRFEAAAPDIDGELSLEVRRAPLARELSWLPAVENRGEGFFIAFRPEAIEDWQQRPAVRRHGERLLAGFEVWQQRHTLGQKLAFPGLPYILLHSLSHLLLTAVSLECGYSASSIRERIYAGDSGYGILLYTGSADAEGTLGGLVEAGRRLERHLRSALDLGRLCSNDPVCAQHQPDNVQEERFLHGAACHGCLLITEPSCERRNQFLDRALVVPTVEELGVELFEEA